MYGAVVVPTSVIPEPGTLGSRYWECSDWLGRGGGGGDGRNVADQQ